MAPTAEDVAKGREIQLRHIRNCFKADPAYDKGVADALGIASSDVPA
jgi:catalase